MSSRGIFLALSKEEEAKLLALEGDDESVESAILEIEERWDEQWLQQMDKSWDAIHRCLGDGSLRNQQPALTAKAVLGVRPLSSRDDWIVSYVPAEDVKSITTALRPVDQPEFRRRYFGLKKSFLGIDRTEYEGEVGEEDFEYSWAYFEEMRSFYAKAATADRAVVFAVDQ